MAKDDMEVVMYKILEYLYACTKHDKKPELTKYGWSSELLDINKAYWCKVIATLARMGMIEGFSIVSTKDGVHIQVEPPVSITYEGTLFLKENSGMQRAKEFCKDTFPTLLSSALGLIV